MFPRSFWVYLVLPAAFSVIIAFLVSLMISSQVVQHDEVAYTRAEMSINRMMDYRRAVLRYLEAQPHTTGTIPLGQLKFSSGYSDANEWAHLIDEAGQLFIWSQRPAGPYEGSILAAYAGHTGLSGVVIDSEGRRTLPGWPAGTAALSQSIPGGSLLLVGR